MTCAGEVCDFSVLDWSCKTLPRVAKSSVAAEVQAATIAEGELAILRLAHQEMLGAKREFDDIDTILKQGIRATMITDCKALFDAECKSETARLGMANRR